MPITQVEEGLKNKTLHQGLLRINKRSFFDAYVTADGFPDDIYIPGKYKRNRAFDGDMVVIQILDGAELKKELEREERENASKKIQEDERRRNVMVEEDDGGILVGDDDPIILDESKVEEARAYGRVVYILDRKEAHVVIGTLSVDNPGNRNNIRPFDGPVSSSINTIWFRPNDQRVPFVVVPVEHVPIEFLKAPSQFTDTLWKLSISKWPAHCQYPYGKVGGMMGLRGEIPVETESLLLENGITWSDFSEEVLACLPPTPWTIPGSEYKSRKDFRSTRIFSVDPLTARDLDDALSIVQLDDGTFEVGVHIADVSHFVHVDTDLDKEAQNRSTTVYLIQKAIPMLPRLLCEELCSLNPGVERLAFSVTWIMDKDANILQEPWFGKSIIKSCAKLSYDHAQALIEGKDWEGLPHVDITGGSTLDTIKADTLLLYEFSLKLRARRYEGGALSINSFKLWFSLDDTGNPVNTGVYELKDSNRMIEEFMLLANMAVARKISNAFPGSAILRRHEPPKPRPLKQFIEFATDIGYLIDASTSQTFQASFDAITSMDVQNVLRQLAIKPMQRAKYFCTGLMETEQWGHYALNVPMYTHFTSPIRRYCDLVVHRQLQAALEAETAKTEPVEPHDTDAVGMFARTCNDRKFSSKDAQDASQRLYLSVYLHTLSQTPSRGIPLTGLESIVGKDRRGILVEALVYKVAERSFDVIVERYGIEKRVWIEESSAMYGVAFEKGAPGVGYKNREKGKEGDGKVLSVYWKVGFVQKGLDEVTKGLEELKVQDTRDKGKESLVIEDIEEDDGGSGWETDENAVVPAKMKKQPAVAVAPAPDEAPSKHGRQQHGRNNGYQQGATPRRSRKRTDMDQSAIITQKIRIFDRIAVVVVPDISRSPPEIKIYLIHPDAVALHKEALVDERVVEYDANGNVSCPAIDDEAH
ncbi:UNVERIFIED_CONTAM: hypothetical protein HDU68_012317 [Siphonaria sp. JEL0065]|nr:hypothetical protein HDU68_012317 [Siphonaria sp. JEL0065]